jgi:hypothetical protein
VSAKLSNQPYDSALLGVVSTSPYMVAGADDGHSIIIALSGRVPVKISDSSAPIQPGDYITSSGEAGKAMKATGAGNVIGKALAAWNPGDGTVMVYIEPGYYPGPSMANVIQNGDNATLTNLTVTGTADFNDLNVSGATTITNLTVQTVTVSGNLTVEGLASVHDLLIDGHIITAGDTPVGVSLTALGASGSLVIDGNDTAGTLTITTGSTGLTAGELGRITFVKAFGKAPRIILSAQDENSDNARIFPASKTAIDYVLKTNQVLAPNTTYIFDYFIAQ